MSHHIRGRCHAISQSPGHPHISGRPRTFHAFPTGKLARGLGTANLMIVHRLSDLDAVDSGLRGTFPAVLLMLPDHVETCS